MSRAPRPPRYRLTALPVVGEDVAALGAFGPDAVEAATAILADLARGGVTGKQLGERHITGDLTGLFRVKFDVPLQRPQRFRVLYREVGQDALEVIAIGPRDEHAAYRAAVERLAENERRGPTSGRQ